MKLKTKFQDKDFKLGEVVIAIINLDIHDKIEVQALKHSGGIVAYRYDSIKDFTDHWEDAPEEPKKHYEILGIGVVIERKNTGDEIFRNQNQREIGNDFETKEEAEKTVEKLKAWKRLKENGFKFTEWGVGFDNNLVIKAEYKRGQIYDDMNLLFSGKDS